MTMTSVNIRMDADIKRQADELFAELGLNMSTAMNMFVRQAIKHQGIPFDIVVSRKEQIIIDAAQEAFTSGKRFKNAADLMEDLLSEDETES